MIDRRIIDPRCLPVGEAGLVYVMEDLLEYKVRLGLSAGTAADSRPICT